MSVEDFQPRSSGGERRRTPRRPVRSTLRISWRERGGVFQETEVRVVDESDLGCGLEARDPVPERIEVRLDREADSARWGQVRHCTSEILCRRVGVEYGSNEIGAQGFEAD